jgi:acyl dehydratase
MKQEELMRRIGSQLGCSDWMRIEQARIDDFARVTEDYNFVHVDPVRAAATPFGCTIAHGLLTLSLIVPLCWDFVPQLDGTALVLNYGFDKVRFITPVKVDARIRATAELADARERKPGQMLICLDVTIEIEGERTPALVAEWLSLHMLAAGAHAS